MPISRPHLLVSDTARPGARSLAQLRESLDQPDAILPLQSLIATADTYLDAPLITPASVLPSRGQTHIDHANRDYNVVAAAGRRVTTCALAALLTQDTRYVQTAMAQVTCLFDTVAWPDWRDKAHPWQPADLRTGQLAYDLGLAYDWLHAMLTAKQRQAFVKGLDERAIQPYFQSIEQGASWGKPQRQDNWVTVIVGGLGVLGMALGEDHPDSGRLVALANETMTRNLAIYQPDGAFNESPGYAASSRKVASFFILLQCHQTADTPTQPSVNSAVWDILAKHCYWLMDMTIPPGRMACFGDTRYRSKPPADFFVAVAAIRRDPVLQWFALNHLPEDQAALTQPELLLWFDPTLEPRSPQGQLPLGRHYPAHGGVVSSRTDWDPRTATCVVTGKAGQAREHHGHHDAGQVCIDAYGKPLIVDLGAPTLYPADFFGEQGRNYYNVAVHGHNLLTIDQQHRTNDNPRQAHYLQAEFNDTKGSFWSIDLTDLHDDVQHVRRDVLHLLPGCVAVLDQASCDDQNEHRQEHRFDLRWHTFDTAKVNGDGSFIVTNDPARLISRVVKLAPPGSIPGITPGITPGNGSALVHANGQHAYVAPFDRNRLGDLLPQEHEPYIQSTTLERGRVALLSLFAVAGEGESYTPWAPGAPAGHDAWQVQVGRRAQTIRLQQQGGWWSFVR